MTSSKKMMFIGWIIGLGTGLFISGIIISAMFYIWNGQQMEQASNAVASNGYELTSMISEELPQEDKKYDATEQTSDPEQASDTEQISDTEQTSDPEQASDTEQTSDPEQISDTEQTNDTEQIIAVTIPPNSSAIQICKLLQEKGVVENSEELKNYIIAKNKTTRLRPGTKKFKANSDMESILQVLISRP